MSWNNGLQRKKFKKEQRILAEQYRVAGMTEEQIQMMYEFDLGVFRSERIFYMHTQELEIKTDDEDEARDVSEYQIACQTKSLRNYANRYWWIDELEKLYYAVKHLSDEEKELITLYAFDGYTQREIAEIQKCSNTAISYRLIKIKEKLRSAQGGK